MGRLIYGMIQSADGFTEDATGRFDWGADADEKMHAHVAELMAGVETYLYGRRMYKTMVFWETAEAMPDLPDGMRAFAAQWRRAEKVVYSTTLDEVRSARTRILRRFDPAEVARMKAEAQGDLTVDGPTLAAEALRAGLVDEVQLYLAPVVAGGGKRFWPEGWATRMRLIDSRSFASGMVVLRYATGG